MCRKNGKVVLCRHLGSNPELWSKRALLESKPWLHEQIDILSECIKLAAKGNIQAAREKVIAEMREQDLQEWFGQHADQSGRSRARVLWGQANATPAIYKNGAPTRRVIMEVFRRDGFRCRYCGLRVILTDVLRAFSQVVGNDAFPFGASGPERHGATRVYLASPDHVIPKGLLENPNTLENLVTACWPCQFGKMEFTLEQLSLANPFDRGPICDKWDGLTSALPELKARLACY